MLFGAFIVKVLCNLVDMDIIFVMLRCLLSSQPRLIDATLKYLVTSPLELLLVLFGKDYIVFRYNFRLISYANKSFDFNYI